MTRGKKTISIPIWYAEWNICILIDSIYAVQDFNGNMYKIFVSNSFHTVNKTPEVTEILSSIWYNL